MTEGRRLCRSQGDSADPAAYSGFAIIMQWHDTPMRLRRYQVDLIGCVHMENTIISTAEPTRATTQASPRFKARMTGVFYLLTIVTGIFAQGFVSGKLVIEGNAAATATNLLTHRGLYQLGFAVYVIEMACQIVTTALFYELLKPAGRSVSLIAAFLGLAGCVIKTFSRVFFIAPLFLLGGAHFLSVFSTEQLQALSLVLLKVNDRGAAMALVFFGFYAVLTGYLIIKSTFLPRTLGELSVLGGVGWLTFLYLPLGYHLFPYIAAFSLLGAAALIVWLLVFGLNEQRWKEQATGW